MKRGMGKGFTLVELLVVIVIIAVLAALLLPAITRAIVNSKVAKCTNNLVQLYKMMYNYSLQLGGSDKLMSNKTGGDFWLHLSQTSPPVIDPGSMKDIYGCPLEGAPQTVGTTDYRGPYADINKTLNFTDGDPIGSDKDGNHGAPAEGGNVLRRSSDCQTVAGNDPLWTLAGTKTIP